MYHIHIYGDFCTDYDYVKIHIEYSSIGFLEYIHTYSSSSSSWEKKRK